MPNTSHTLVPVRTLVQGTCAREDADGPTTIQAPFRRGLKAHEWEQRVSIGFCVVCPRTRSTISSSDVTVLV